MQLRTVKTIRSGTYTIRFETDFTDAEDTLIDSYGDPTISVGGIFNGDTISFTGDISIGEVIRRGSACGNYFKTNYVRLIGSTNFSTGTLTSHLATITSVNLISFTVADANKALSADFPFSESFYSQKEAEVYADTIKSRASTAMDTLRANDDSFSTDVSATV